MCPQYIGESLYYKAPLEDHESLPIQHVIAPYKDLRH